jgi:RHS repeat-associated protein
LKQKQIHAPPSGAGELVQLTEYDYDHVGRKTACYQTINSGTREKIASYSYDAVGRLSQKKIMPDGNYTTDGTPASIVRPPNPSANTNDVATQFISLQPGVLIDPANLGTYLAQIGTGGGGTSINGLQKIDYNWHIRGGLRGINLDNGQNPTPNTGEADLFSYKLDYETAGFYDGNIGKQSWSVAPPSGGQTGLAGGAVVRSYTFNYDPTKRLKSATYTGINGENYSLPNMSYDRNGNITNLQRNGKTESGFGQIDNLSYSYNGNRLNQITDGVSGSHEVDFVQRGGTNYTYWPDGSLKSDDNKEITLINYDSFLQLPVEIQLTGSRWLKMYYDGSGKLLKRAFSTGEIWEFSNGMIYKNGQPYQLTTPEGRAIYQNGTWQSEFFHTDHLGNARVSFRANNGQLEKTDETAFDPTGIVLNGMGQENNFENRYKHQGKESLALFGLSGINDFGARYLDKTIGGRWLAVDAYADFNSQESLSPFQYVGNNPLNNIDPDGNWFFGLFGSTSEQRRAARDFAKESGGTVENWARKDIHVNYTSGGRVNSAGEAEIVGTSRYFRKNGTPDMGPNANKANDKADQEAWDALPVGYQGKGSGAIEFDAMTQLSLGLTATSILKPAFQAAVPQAQVQINRNAGNAFRDELAEAIRQEGREVITEVYKNTPFGKRFIDIQVSKNGKVLGGIEAKTGRARYRSAQRAKDFWLEMTEGYKVNVVRKPNNW